MLLSLALGVATLLMAGLGYKMSESSSMTRRQKYVYRVIFGVCAVVSLVLIGVQGRKTDQSERAAEAANQKLSQSLEDIHKGSQEISRQQAEIARVQKLNTELQEKLLGQSGQLITSSEQIAKLSQEGIETVTGGSSFCYMRLNNQWDVRGLVPFFIHQGKNTLYDVNARISNLGIQHPDPKTVDAKTLLSADPQLELGNLSAPSVLIPPNPPIYNGANQYDLNVFFNARNGYWTQELLVRRVGNEWAHAFRVTRELNSGKSEIIFTRIDNNFPKQELKGKWKRSGRFAR